MIHLRPRGRKQHAARSRCACCYIKIYIRWTLSVLFWKKKKKKIKKKKLNSAGRGILYVHLDSRTTTYNDRVVVSASAAEWVSIEINCLLKRIFFFFFSIADAFLSLPRFFFSFFFLPPVPKRVCLVSETRALFVNYQVRFFRRSSPPRPSPQESPSNCPVLHLLRRVFFFPSPSADRQSPAFY